MRRTRIAIAGVLSFGLTTLAAQSARAQVALGDIVQTALNGQLVIAEVVRAEEEGVLNLQRAAPPAELISQRTYSDSAPQFTGAPG